MKSMTFKLAVCRDVVGSRIDITIDTEPDRLIDRVTTTLDNFGLADDHLRTPSTHFERGFVQAGSAGNLQQSHRTLAIQWSSRIAIG